MVLRRLNRNSEPQASIESGQYTIQYVYSFPAIWSFLKHRVLKSRTLCKLYIDLVLADIEYEGASSSAFEYRVYFQHHGSC